MNEIDNTMLQNFRHAAKRCPEGESQLYVLTLRNESDLHQQANFNPKGTRRRRTNKCEAGGRI